MECESTRIISFMKEARLAFSTVGGLGSVLTGEISQARQGYIKPLQVPAVMRLFVKTSIFDGHHTNSVKSLNSGPLIFTSTRSEHKRINPNGQPG